MAVIPVPRPPRTAFNKNRPISLLLRTQLEHLEHVVQAAMRSGRFAGELPKRPRSILTEGQAAAYIAQMTARLHPEGAAAAPPEGAAAPGPAPVTPRAQKRAPKKTAKAPKTNRKKEGKKKGKILPVIALLVSLSALSAALSALTALPANAQESRVHADLRKEGENIGQNCGTFDAKGAASCAIELATDEPVHVAVGSLPPQNGFGFGGAFVEHYTPNESWRLSWDADAVATTSGAWRAGVYMKSIRTARAPIQVITNPGAQPVSTGAIHEYPVFNLYLEAISLDRVLFYGLGPSSLRSGKSVFGERQIVAGGNAVIPITRPAFLARLNTSVIGGVNGRFIDLRDSTSGLAPLTRSLYDDSTAPGLSHQPGFAEFAEGVRFRPVWLNGGLQPDYLVSFQQFVASADAHSSFTRWTVDLNHQIPLYKTVGSSFTRPKETNGPDECRESVGSDRCPSISRNREGSVGFRFLLTSSSPFSGSVVPFYLQPTLGGSDLNGNNVLPSYDDYRFRGPNLIALQETFEHSLAGPVGVWFLADQGKVTLARSDLDLTNLDHSFAVGLTLRAGGFPIVNIAFAWGGAEGHHVLARMDSSLLGGSARPSLY